MSDVPRITTPRLVLRGWLPGDRAPFAEMSADPVVMEHFPAPLSEAETDALLERIAQGWRERGIGLWAVEAGKDGAFLGFAGLAPIPDGVPAAPGIEIGWRLARDAWGQGYATEAARAIVEHAFDVVRLDELVSFTIPANTRSRRVMEKLGMTRDPADDFEHPRIPVGHPMRRHVLYRLQRAEWVSRGR